MFRIFIVLPLIAVSVYLAGCATMLVHDRSGEWKPSTVRIDEVVRADGKLYVEYKVSYYHSRREAHIKRSRKWAIINLEKKEKDGSYIRKTIEPGFRNIPDGENIVKIESEAYKNHFQNNFLPAANAVALYSKNDDEVVVVATYDQETGLPQGSSYSLAQVEKTPIASASAALLYPPALAYDVVTFPLQAGFVISAIFVGGFWPE